MDWSANAGVLGLTALLAFHAGIGWGLLRRRRAVLFCLWVAWGVFGMFHLTVRHPWYWFSVAFLLSQAYTPHPLENPSTVESRETP